MTALERHPVAVSVAGTAALMTVLVTLAVAVPMSVTAEHFSGHLAMGIPLLLLLALGLRTWPRPGPRFAARLARGTLLAGLAIGGVGLLTEAIGAFGYDDDGYGRANALADLHAVGVGVWPVGSVLLLVGAIMTAGALLAGRRGAAHSRIVLGATMLAVAAAVVFTGGFVLGF